MKSPSGIAKFVIFSDSGRPTEDLEYYRSEVLSISYFSNALLGFLRRYCFPLVTLRVARWRPRVTRKRHENRPYLRGA